MTMKFAAMDVSISEAPCPTPRAKKSALTEVSALKPLLAIRS
jgi:hypothetical protein